MSPVNVPEKWDHETDVLIIGGGTAGLPAGITAVAEGCKATVLETQPKAGGSFAMVAGAFTVAGCQEQKDVGIDDNPDLLYQDFIEICDAVPDVARAYADNHHEAYRMLIDEGIKFPGIVPHPLHNRQRCLGWIGGMGPLFVKALLGRCERDGVEILYRHRARKLIKDTSGKVVGATVEVGGETKMFKANKGVVLASGGFGRNKRLIAESDPVMVNCIPKMPISHRGDGLIMGMDAGAATKDMSVSMAASWPLCVETHANAIWLLDYGALFVNVNGKRYHDESSAEGFYGPMTRAGMLQPGGVYWIVFTDEIMDLVGTVDIIGREGDPVKNQEQIDGVKACKTYTADTIEEVGKLAGFEGETAAKVIAKYNSDIDEVGYDTVFGRKKQFGDRGDMMKISGPPYHSIKCITALTSNKGGLKINGKCEVIDNYDEAIPGLYAAGETTGGLNSKTYLLGCMTSSAMTQGILAARHCVREN